jgi:hypothetical protein
MALVFTIIIVVAVLCLGHYLFERDDDQDHHNEWKGW